MMIGSTQCGELVPETKEKKKHVGDWSTKCANAILRCYLHVRFRLAAWTLSRRVASKEVPIVMARIIRIATKKNAGIFVLNSTMDFQLHFSMYMVWIRHGIRAEANKSILTRAWI